MPLLRTRPTVRLRTPRDVVPGLPFEIAVLLDATEPVDIEWCDVVVTGREDGGPAGHALMPTVAARVCGARLLPVGTTTLPCRLALPENVPRSKSGLGARVTYTVAVHASVPWWPDARGQFSLHVVAKPGEPLVGTRRVAVSRIEGPIDGSAYAELSVSSDVVELGGVVDARISMRDVGEARRSLSLVAYETPRHGQTARAGAWTIAADAEALAFRVPDDITPTMAGASFTLDYWLVAQAHGAFGPLVSASLPIRVVDRGGARTTNRIVAPHVGDARLEELFTAVGEAEGATIEPGPTLVVRRGEVQARATRELGRDGTRLAVHVTYPDLHLDLHVHERSLLALTRGGRRVARAAGLGPRCVVDARDGAQASVLLERISARMERARAIEMTDSTLRYEVLTSANDRQSVGRVVRDMVGLVEALTLPVPMPTALVGATHAWSLLARELSGRIESGHARVIAGDDDVAIHVETTFEANGAPSGTVVLVRPTRELRVEKPLRFEGVALPADAGIAPEARAVVERLGKLGHLLVDSREIRVVVDAPLGVGLPVVRAKEIVDASLRLAAALRPSSGPFR